MKKILFLAFLLFCVFNLNAFSAVRTWDGGGTDANWTTAANWVGDVAPVAGDDLVFPTNAAQFTTNNNFFIFTNFRSISIEGGIYTINGNPFSLSNGLTVGGGSHNINTAIALSAAQTFSIARSALTTIAVLSVGNFSLTLDGEGNFGIGVISGSGNLIKIGLGAHLIYGASDYSGAITINDGILVVDANIPNSPVTVNSPPTFGVYALSGLAGTGTVGAMTIASGGISSGTLNSPTGILNTGNLSFGSNGIYVAKIGGKTPGANGYDQLNVTGTVNLNNARLAPVPLNFRPAIGDSFVILRNDGTDAINGTFLNLPEGAVFAGALNSAFRITYRGGDGNDIAITSVNHANFDFDGDGKADVSVFRPSSGVWYELLSGNGGFAARQFGSPEDKIVPADYDGDNKTDIAVYRPSNGTWYRINSSDNTFFAVQFGASEDVPVPNDYDGDGKADIAVFRPSNGTWYELRSIANQFFAQQFGQTGDKPLVGDFDGDGLGDLAVFRNGNWYVFESASNSMRAIQFGAPTDIAVPADYDGDGKTDVAVFRPSNGVWYQLNSGSNNSFSALQFGVSEDKPVPVDYDGDGKADIAVFRPSSGVWYLQRSTAGFTGVQFGQNGDTPIPNAFVK